MDDSYDPFTEETEDKSSAIVGSAKYDFYKNNGAEVVYFDETPSLTRQEFKDECDINLIMERYNNHVIGGPGGLPPIGEPMFVDWADMPSDLLSYMERMKEAETAFMSLPANVRREFDNSAVSFVDFAGDPSNLDRMREWGLAPAKKLPDAPIEPAPSPPPSNPDGSSS